MLLIFVKGGLTKGICWNILLTVSINLLINENKVCNIGIARYYVLIEDKSQSGNRYLLLNLNISKHPYWLFSMNFSISLILSIKMLIIAWVLRLPVRIQIIFGGKPYNEVRSLKSESCVTIIKLLFFANSQICLSRALINPSLFTVVEPEKSSGRRFNSL